MPFTPTHILAVLPLWPVRRYLPFVALVIGSMVPDLPLFFPIVGYNETHVTRGALLYCLPLGLGSYLIFECVMRRPMTELLPRWVRNRLRPDAGLPSFTTRVQYVWWLLGVSLAIVISAITHQIWDAFTHQGRWGTEVIIGLNAKFTLVGIEMAGYKWLQYGSTLIGLPLLITLAAITLKRTKPITQVPLHTCRANQILVGTFLILTPCIVAVYAVLATGSFYRALGMTIMRSGAIIMAGLLAYCIVIQIARLNAPRR